MNIEQLLISGGDTRLALDPETQANRYRCPPLPLPGIHSFSSCTARTISSQALAIVKQASRDFTPETMMDKMNALRHELAVVLGIDAMGASVVLSASGTDTTLYALFLARVLHPGPLDSLVLAPHETGTGVPYVAAGLHPDTQTSQGAAVVKGEPIKPFATGVTLCLISVRNVLGALRPQAEIDQAVLDQVAQSVAEGRRVLLHALDSSKYGSLYPSLACLETLQQRYGQAVQILVDACQGRLPLARLHEHLRNGRLVSITGSKFFTGPPFSGALLIPQSLSEGISCIQSVPPSLYDYTDASAWPSIFSGIQNSLPFAPNAGLYARWVAALSEMNAFFQVPQDFRESLLQAYENAILPILQRSPYLQLLSVCVPSSQPVNHHGQRDMMTIFPFFVVFQGQRLLFPQCQKLYRQLYEDISSQLPLDASVEEKKLAAQRFHLGQPLAMNCAEGEVGVLRLCTDARMVYQHFQRLSENAAGRALTENMNVLTIVETDMIAIRSLLAKIALILHDAQTLLE